MEKRVKAKRAERKLKGRGEKGVFPGRGVEMQRDVNDKEERLPEDGGRIDRLFFLLRFFRK